MNDIKRARLIVAQNRLNERELPRADQDHELGRMVVEAMMVARADDDARLDGLESRIDLLEGG